MSATSGAQTVCITCRLPRAGYACGICQQPICKKCLQKLEKDAFPFLKQVADELKHRIYCSNCYSEKVEPVKSAYDRDIAKARQVFVFTKAKSEETRLMSRSEKPLKVTDCEDRSETLMRLAFLAVRAGCNALIDVEVDAKKVRNAGYQTSRYQGIGVPTCVDADRLNRLTTPR